jgi:hypothetical protein
MAAEPYAVARTGGHTFNLRVERSCGNVLADNELGPAAIARQLQMARSSVYRFLADGAAAQIMWAPVRASPPTKLGFVSSRRGVKQ